MSNIELVSNPFLFPGIITVGKHLFAVDGGGGTIKEVKDHLSRNLNWFFFFWLYEGMY